MNTEEGVFSVTYLYVNLNTDIPATARHCLCDSPWIQTHRPTHAVQDDPQELRDREADRCDRHQHAQAGHLPGFLVPFHKAGCWLCLLGERIMYFLEASSRREEEKIRTHNVGSAQLINLRI